VNLAERVKAIILQPKVEWPMIGGEPGDTGYLFPNYVCIVSAIPPVGSFIVCVFVVYLVIFGIVGALFGLGMVGTMGRL
jgi:hypothetical protein